MVLDIRNIFISEGTSLAVNYELDMSDMEFSGVCPITKPVTVTGSVKNSAGVVSVKLACEVDYTAPCDRCGKIATRHHTVKIDRVLVSQLANDADDDIIEIPDMKLDADELCITEIVLCLPMKHLCKEECLGVCPTCGKDLNEGMCDCKSETVDSRLAALAQLLD